MAIDLSTAGLIARMLLVCMFPVSAVDKMLHWHAAPKQADSSFLPGGPLLLILAMAVERAAPACIVPLSGRWWVESMDGERVGMGPGEVSSGEDQNCVKDADGGLGHRSGTLGDEPARLTIVQMHRPPIGAACHLA